MLTRPMSTRLFLLHHRLLLTRKASSSSSITVSDSGPAGVRTLTLNRPDRRNAFTVEMMRLLPSLLSEAAEDKDVGVTVLTGAGNFYSSGNDLTNFATPNFTVEDAARVLRDFVQAFVDFPKPLLACVNGPAIGIAFTTLALCDSIYCCEDATFHTPFVALGQSPEGCSSFLFPRIMGQSVAAEVLLQGRKLSAEEARAMGLVSEVVVGGREVLAARVAEIAGRMAKLPRGASMTTKAMMRAETKEVLRRVNERECEVLMERWKSEECHNAIMAFATRKRT